MSSTGIGGKSRPSAAASAAAPAAAANKPTAYDGKVAGLYDLGDTLGRGHFAVVKLARHVFTGEKVAVKVIDKTKLDEVSRAHLFQEVRCMKLVQHPNVVRLYEVIDTQTKLYLILELGDGGDMYDYIMRHEKGLDDEAARKYFAQIVHAISYCHRLHVVHRDLKPENVVFFEKLGMVKLTDFGFSNRFCPGQKLETSCGSLAYSAPEILLGDSYDAPAVDVWSLGVILYMLVCGHAPFQEANDSETLTMIMDCKYTIPPHVSSECSRLIQRLLIRDPEKRATLEEIASDPWLESDINVQHADYLPLVSREHLSDEDHAHILQKMANGNIATQEEIVSALDKNAYNHITATYFLLAERKLRALRQEQAQMLNTTQVSGLAALAISPRNPSIPCPPSESLPRTVEGLVSPQEARRAIGSQVATCALDLPPNCHCRSRSNSRLGLGSLPFLVRDELLKSSSTKSLTSSKVKRTTFKVAADKMDDEDDAKACEGPSSSPSAVSSSVVRASLQSQFAANKFKPVTGPSNRKLHSVRSSPQLTLNEIYEEVESDCEVSSVGQTSFVPHLPTTRVLQSQLSIASPSVLRKYEQRRLYAKGRTASCSSSDASDDDTDITRKRKAEKLKQRVPGGRWNDGHWEDDNDPNSGAGGPGGTGGAGGGAAASGSANSGFGQQEPSESEERPPSSPGHERPSSSPERRRPADDSTEKQPKLSRRHADLKQQNHVHSWPSVSSSVSNSSLQTTPSRSRSPASIAYSIASSSPPPSPLSGAPNITSLRQSKTLSQLNRYVSQMQTQMATPVPAFSSDVDKENREVAWIRSPLHFLNLKRTGRHRDRPSSYHQTSSTNSSMMAPPSSANSAPEISLSQRSSYKQGLYRLLKHAPHLGGSKRWDINRNGLSSPDGLVVDSPPLPATRYSLAGGAASGAAGPGLRVSSSSGGGGAASAAAPSHSKCCSLC